VACAGNVTVVSEPFAPSTPLPAASFTRVSATLVEVFTNAATLDSPGSTPSSASNSKSSITTLAAPEAIESARPRAEGATFAFLTGS
jgi:hypothetical protein